MLHRSRQFVYRVHRNLEISGGIPKRRSGERLLRGELSVAIRLDPILRLDRVMTERLRDVFLMSSTASLQRRQDLAMQQLSLRTKDRIIGHLTNEIVRKFVFRGSKPSRLDQKVQDFQRPKPALQ